MSKFQRSSQQLIEKLGAKMALLDHILRKSKLKFQNCDKQTKHDLNCKNLFFLIEYNKIEYYSFLHFKYIYSIILD